MFCLGGEKAVRSPADIALTEVFTQTQYCRRCNTEASTSREDVLQSMILWLEQRSKRGDGINEAERAQLCER